MTEIGNRIDVHHLLIPPAFVKAMRAKGLAEVAEAPLPDWLHESSVTDVGVHGIATSILLSAARGVNLSGNSRNVSEQMRVCNEFSAEIAGKTPGLFGSFAALPMPFTD